MAEPIQPDRGARWPILLLMAAAPVISVFVVLYLVLVYIPKINKIEQNRDTMLKAVGLDRPVSNRLDARYTDADGDLVADPPSDPAKFVRPAVFRLAAYLGGSARRDVAAGMYEPLRLKLQELLGVPVEMADFYDSHTQLRALRDGELHAAMLNTGSVPMAVNAAGFVPLFKEAGDDGTGFHQMEIIVPATSPVRSVGDLKGGEIIFTDPSSNSGFKAAVLLLRSEFKLEPETGYLFRYSGSHRESIRIIAEKLLRGERYAAAVANDLLKNMIANGAVRTDQVRSIYKSYNFPNGTFGIASNLDPDLSRKIRVGLKDFAWTFSPAPPASAPTTTQAAEEALDLLEPPGPRSFRLLPVDYKADFEHIRRIDDQKGELHKLD